MLKDQEDNIIPFQREKTMKEIIAENREKRMADEQRMYDEIEELLLVSKTFVPVWNPQKGNL
ncbi:hypothetical protein [Paenibacillus chibensis]|uniref:hypothetical protein n=1 Tax=Paenibacillus chibensis TaxID=59846 RepID=UPI000FD6FB90|nr:hypothetical protein [Paenibacillus chibensis]MEC0371568.1 hypothetical protein [Paenibacillus chibensis]